MTHQEEFHDALGRLEEAVTQMGLLVLTLRRLIQQLRAGEEPRDAGQT